LDHYLFRACSHCYNRIIVDDYLWGFSLSYSATVKAAKAFFKQMDELEKRVRVNKPKTNDVEAVALYSTALDILDQYLDLVELPPIDSGHYEKEFDTLVGETARIT
jgi:hypothetical protein